jgi:hypothetical protein
MDLERVPLPTTAPLEEVISVPLMICSRKSQQSA